MLILDREHHIEIVVDKTLPDSAFFLASSAKIPIHCVVRITPHITEHEWFFQKYDYNPFGGPYHARYGNQDHREHFNNEPVLVRPIKWDRFDDIFTTQWNHEQALSEYPWNGLYDLAIHADMIRRAHVWNNQFVQIKDTGISRSTVTVGNDFLTIHRAQQRSYYFTKHRFEFGSTPMSHRDDGPATIFLDDIVETRRSGKRESLTFKSYSRADWYLNGNLIPQTKINQWAKMNHIVLSEGPCHDRSAFLRPEDEMVFISEFG